MPTGALRRNVQCNVGAFSDVINVVMTCEHVWRNFCQAGWSYPINLHQMKLLSRKYYPLKL